MTLMAFLVDNEEFIPIEVFLAGQESALKAKAIRMLEQGELQARGRTLLMDDGPFQSGLGKVFDISVESWIDGDHNALETSLLGEHKFQLKGWHPEDVTVDITLHNSERFRELVGFEGPSISVEAFDDQFLRVVNGKMGSKVWAHAAAALASEKTSATVRGLATYLLAHDDIWKHGKLSEDRLRKVLTPFVNEFNNLLNPK